MVICISSVSGQYRAGSLSSLYYYYYGYSDFYYGSCYVGTSYGDGYCDADLNNEDCGYDGGDCCICTCEDGTAFSVHSCEDNIFFCLDPYADTDCALASTPTPNPVISPTTPPSSTGTPTSDSTPSPDSACEGQESSAGDGYCDESNNSLACDWDGGDCCPCTCEEAEYSCETFECLDPDAPTDCGADGSEGSDASSAGFTTATDTSFSSLEVTGIVIASVTGYCFLGGLLTLAVTSILRKRREKKRFAKNTTEVV